MIAALILALLGDPVVRLDVTPSTVEVGQPVSVTLELEVDADQVLDRPFDTDLAFDDTWGVLDLRREAPRSAAAGRAVTRWNWSVASLEPGERDLAALVEALDVGRALEGGTPLITVQSVLGAEETSPRPLIGWDADLELGEPVLAGSLVPWFVGGWYLAIAALIGAVLWRTGALRGLRKSKQSDGVEPLTARIAALPLEGVRTATLGELRDTTFRLTSLVREAVDERCGGRTPGETDEQWLANVLAEARLDSNTRERLSSLFDRTSRVKYAGERPSDFALDELVSDARRLLGDLTGSAVEVAA